MVQKAFTLKTVQDSPFQEREKNSFIAGACLNKKQKQKTQQQQKPTMR